MKKYSKYTHAELIDVIIDKNNTIAKLNGQIYYYKQLESKYKEGQKKYYNKLRELERVNNGK